MRLSFISALALISAIMPVQGAVEQVGVASSRSSLDSPSLFAVRKNPPSPTSTSAVFGIPRGGAGAVASAKAPAKPTSIVGGGLKLPSDIFSKEKIPWTISLVINLVYVFFFFQRISAPVPCDFAKAGFCVTGLKDGECSLLFNSHTWAFIVDMVFTYLGLTSRTNRPKLVQYVLVSTIFSHGLLHGVLGSYAKCGALLIPGGDAIFTVFAAFISFAVLFVGSSLPPLQMGALSAFGGWLTLKLAGPDGSYGVSSIFLITQILVSLSSVFFPGKNIKNMEELGHSFVPPCLISLIELLYCCDGGGGESLFNQLGGHVWYDIFLHRSVLVAIRNGVDEE